MTTPADPFADWLAAARTGSTSDLGRALEACRAYLLLIAESELGSTLRPKAGASDIVQESMIDAQTGFAGFQGRTRNEFIAWVTGILRHNLTDLARRYRGRGRAVGRECGLPAVDPPAAGPTASAIYTADEEQLRLRRAIAGLPDEARLVLAWRQHDRLDWATIGDRLGKSADAARKVWFRAVEQLRTSLRPGSDDDRVTT
jgi:RNA polymerase sigma-70 factor, ECF subfamily